MASIVVPQRRIEYTREYSKGLAIIPMTTSEHRTINLAVLAGGAGRRLNQPCKPLVELAGKALIQHCLDRLENPLIAQTAVCANENPALIERGLTCIADAQPGFGPMSALLGAMQWCHAANPHALLLTCPADTPFLPTNLLTELLATWQMLELEVLVVASHGQIHPTIGLWSPALLSQRLNSYLIKEGKKSMQHWLGQCRHAVLDFTSQAPDPFFNINTPSDFEHARARLKAPN